MQEKKSYLVRTRYDFFSCMSLCGLRRYQMQARPVEFHALLQAWNTDAHAPCYINERVCVCSRVGRRFLFSNWCFKRGSRGAQEMHARPYSLRLPNHCQKWLGFSRPKSPQIIFRHLGLYMNLKHFGEISQTTGGDQSTQKFSICPPPNALPPPKIYLCVRSRLLLSPQFWLHQLHLLY